MRVPRLSFGAYCVPRASSAWPCIACLVAVRFWILCHSAEAVHNLAGKKRDETDVAAGTPEADTVQSRGGAQPAPPAALTNGHGSPAAAADGSSAVKSKASELEELFRSSLSAKNEELQRNAALLDALRHELGAEVAHVANLNAQLAAAQDELIAKDLHLEQASGRVLQLEQELYNTLQEQTALKEFRAGPGTVSDGLVGGGVEAGAGRAGARWGEEDRIIEELNAREAGSQRRILELEGEVAALRQVVAATLHHTMTGAAGVQDKGSTGAGWGREGVGEAGAAEMWKREADSLRKRVKELTQQLDAQHRPTLNEA